jgi:hypothetical protein
MMVYDVCVAAATSPATSSSVADPYQSRFENPIQALLAEHRCRRLKSRFEGFRALRGISSEWSKAFLAQSRPLEGILKQALKYLIRVYILFEIKIAREYRFRVFEIINRRRGL